MSIYFVHAATWYPSSAFAETEEGLWLASHILLFFHQMCWVLDAFQPCTRRWKQGNAFLAVRGCALHGGSLRIIPPRVQFYQGCFRGTGSRERRGQASMTVGLSFVLTINRNPVTMETNWQTKQLACEKAPSLHLMLEEQGITIPGWNEGCGWESDTQWDREDHQTPVKRGLCSWWMVTLHRTWSVDTGRKWGGPISDWGWSDEALS